MRWHKHLPATSQPRGSKPRRAFHAKEIAGLIGVPTARTLHRDQTEELLFAESGFMREVNPTEVVDFGHNDIEFITFFNNIGNAIDAFER